MILAGDVGGTKVHLALYNFEGGRLAQVRDHKFPAADFACLDDVVKACDPVWAKVVGDFRPRGGISTVVEATHPRPEVK